MPIHSMRTIYWMYRSERTTLVLEVHDVRRTQENDDGCGAPRGRQPSVFLHPRSVEIRRLHPHAEARPGNEPEVAHDDVGLLVALPRIVAPGHDSFLRPRHSRWLPPHEWLQQPHF